MADASCGLNVAAGQRTQLLGAGISDGSQMARNQVGRMPNLDIRFWTNNSTGLQLADLMAHPDRPYVINPGAAEQGPRLDWNPNSG